MKRFTKSAAAIAVGAGTIAAALGAVPANAATASGATATESLNCSTDAVQLCLTSPAPYGFVDTTKPVTVTGIGRPGSTVTLDANRQTTPVGSVVVPRSTKWSITVPANTFVALDGDDDYAHFSVLMSDELGGYEAALSAWVDTLAPA